MTVKRALQNRAQTGRHAAKRLCIDEGAASWPFDCSDLNLSLADLSPEAERFLAQIGVCSGVHAAADNSMSAQYCLASALANYSTWRGLTEQAW